MNWNIKDHGDAIEKKYHNFISQHHTSYKEFWSKYIGNYKGKPIAIINIDKSIDYERKITGQWNYTILKNIISLYELGKKYQKLNFKLSKLIEFERDYILCIHLFYNIIEIAEKLVALNKLRIKSSNYLNFRNLRNSIAHNIRPLTRYSDSNYYVMKNLNWFENHLLPRNQAWVWDEFDFSGLQFEPLSSFIIKKLQQSMTLFNEILKKLIKAEKVERWIIPKFEEFEQNNKMNFKIDNIITGASGSPYTNE